MYTYIKRQNFKLIVTKNWGSNFLYGYGHELFLDAVVGLVQENFIKRMKILCFYFYNLWINMLISWYDTFYFVTIMYIFKWHKSITYKTRKI